MDAKYYFSLEYLSDKGTSMIKLNSTIHKRLIAQASEAKSLDLVDLADGVLGAIGPVSREENEETPIFSHADLEQEAYNLLWKIAIATVSYHDLEHIDIQRINDILPKLVSKVLASVEEAIDRENDVGPFEMKLPGEKVSLL